MISNPKMITLGRESRGLTQKELANLLNITQGSMSKLEQGVLHANEDMLSLLGRELKYPPSFFTQKGDILPENFLYRKKVSLSGTMLKRQSSYMAICRLMVQRMISTSFVPLRRFPVIQVTEEVSPRDIANAVREQLDIPKGPILNLIEVVEKSGIIVIGIDLDTDKVAGKGIITEGIPIIYYNINLPADRQRFTIAHEFGHIVMHLNVFPDGDTQVEMEANKFASEFLMPAAQIRQDLSVPLNLSSLGALKKKWKVSMSSLIIRAKDLGIMSDREFTFFMSRFSQWGYKMREPAQFDFLPEETSLYEEMIERFAKYKGVEIIDVPKLFYLDQKEFFEKYGGNYRMKYMIN